MRIFQILFLFFVCIPAAGAAETPWVSTDHMQAKLIGSGDDVAVQIRLSKGWHTYWRVPGDAGLPPRFDWAGSENLAGVDMDWPAPKRFEEFGLQTFGYADEIIFPATVTREDVAADTALALKLDVMVCSDICIPQVLELALDLEPEAARGAAKIIEHARRKIPVSGELPGLKIDTAVAGPDGLVLSVFSQNGFDDFDVFAFADLAAFTATPEIIIDEQESRKAMIKVGKPQEVEDLNGFLSGKKLSITLVSGKDAIEKVIEF